MSNRTSQIRRVLTSDTALAGGDTMFVVDLYENGKLVQCRELPGKSRHYAEDVAENWQNGIIQLLTE